jgi:hypothetical protein
LTGQSSIRCHPQISKAAGYWSPAFAGMTRHEGRVRRTDSYERN